MSDQIDQFCENLRIKLTGIDSNIQALKAKIDAKAKTAEQDARTYLDSIKKRIDQDRSKVQAAEKELKKWLEEYRVVTKEKIADWKNSGERIKLRSRADFAERYAKATVVIATAAVDAAEQAALEAWLARKDAQSDAKAA